MHQIRSMPITAEASNDPHESQAASDHLRGTRPPQHDDTAASKHAQSSAAETASSDVIQATAGQAEDDHGPGHSDAAQAAHGSGDGEVAEIDWSAALDVSTDATGADAEAGTEADELQGDIDWDIDLADVEVLEDDAAATGMPEAGEIRRPHGRYKLY